MALFRNLSACLCDLAHLSECNAQAGADRSVSGIPWRLSENAKFFARSRKAVFDRQVGREACTWGVVILCDLLIAAIRGVCGGPCL